MLHVLLRIRRKNQVNAATEDTMVTVTLIDKIFSAAMILKFNNKTSQKMLLIVLLAAKDK